MNQTMDFSEIKEINCKTEVNFGVVAAKNRSLHILSSDCVILLAKL